MARIAVRVDGGSDIGYGHLIRTSALVALLVSEGHDVICATTTPDAARDVLPRTVDKVELPARGDPSPFADLLDENPIDAVFVDAYPVDTDYQRTIRERVPLTIHVDDVRHPVCSDVLVNGNLYGPDLDYDFVGVEPEWCLGPEYTLLREAVSSLAARDPPWRATPERAVVTMGGSDVANLTPAVVRAFDGFDLRVDAIVGPGFSNEAEVEAAAGETDAEVRVSCDPDDLLERVFAADLAVSTCGSTVYELLALGTPFVGVPVVDNQEPIARALRRRDLATVVDLVDDATDGTDGAVGTAIRTLIEDGSLRRRRREAGRHLVDGRGARRVATKILDRAGGSRNA